MGNRPSVMLNNPAQQYAERNERIVNFTSEHGGGLISFRADDERGELRVDVHRQDPTVTVRVEGHHVVPKEEADGPRAALFDSGELEGVVMQALDLYRREQSDYAEQMRAVAQEIRAGRLIAPFAAGEPGALAAEQRATDHDHRGEQAERAIDKINAWLSRD